MLLVEAFHSGTALQGITFKILLTNFNLKWKVEKEEQIYFFHQGVPGPCTHVSCLKICFDLKCYLKTLFW